MYQTIDKVEDALHVLGCWLWVIALVGALLAVCVLLVLALGWWCLPLAAVGAALVYWFLAEWVKAEDLIAPGMAYWKPPPTEEQEKHG